LRTLLPAVARHDAHSISLFWMPPAQVLIKTKPTLPLTPSPQIPG